MKRLAIIAALALPTAASAVSVHPYTPGGIDSCVDACSHGEALFAFGVPDGEPQPMTMPAGSMVVHNSYAPKGEAVWLRDFNRPLAGDETGVGYEATLPDGKRGFLFLADACGNWMFVVPTSYAPEWPSQRITRPPEYTAYPQAHYGGYGGSHAAWGPIYGITTTHPTVPWSDNVTVITSETPGIDTPAPVPLPAAGWFMIAAIGVLFIEKRKVK